MNEISSFNYIWKHCIYFYFNATRDTDLILHQFIVLFEKTVLYKL